MPLHDAMFCEANPGPVKYAGWRLGLCSAETRLPLVPLSEAAKKQVDAALIGLGLVQQRAAE
jgi:4-hydroxy-tetrahydrodipicolinate synthase